MENTPLTSSHPRVATGLTGPGSSHNLASEGVSVFKGGSFYNEIDPKAASWLRQLIADGLIPDGVVDTRSIIEIQPHELLGYTQCHFFAGIGGWPLALALAGWDSTRPVWTGSCPCQPFSFAGAQSGIDDERHLWPVFFKLIQACAPPVVFGEQVASALVVGKAGGGHKAEDGPVWLDGVCTDLESAGYATGACVLGAHSVGSPHIRQRLYWLADAASRNPCNREEQRGWIDGFRADSGRDCRNTGDDERAQDPASRMADSPSRGQRIDRSASRQAGHDDERGTVGGVDNPEQSRLEGHGGPEGGCDKSRREPTSATGSTEQTGDVSHWADFTLIPCADGKARRIEPGVAPLAHGLPRGVVHSCDPREQGYAQNTAEARVMRLRGYGNAIVPQVAALFIESYLAEKGEFQNE